MARMLPPEVVQDRLRDYVASHYLMLISVIKGVVLGFAALALLAAFGDRQTVVPRLAFWAASIAAALVSYVTWARGVVLTNEKYSVFDAVWPLLMGIAEILLFAILLPDDKRPWFWWNWYLVLAAHSFCAFLLTGNRIKQTDVPNDFDPKLKDLGDLYKQWVQSDHRVTFWISVAATIVWAVMRWVVLPWSHWAVQLQALLGLGVFVMLWMASVEAVKQRTTIDEKTTEAVQQGK